jgi:hypothetical protein
LPGTGRKLSAAAVANYIAKYATKTSTLWCRKPVTWADALLSAVPRPVPGEPVLGRPDVR